MKILFPVIFLAAEAFALRLHPGTQAPASDWGAYRAIGRLPSHVVEFATQELPVQKRDGLWPWQKEPHIIGKYPDGRPKCKIMSATAGHLEGPCPSKLPPEEVQKIIHEEWCAQNCCKKNGEPCRFDDD